MVRIILTVFTLMVFSANSFAFGIPKLASKGSTNAPAVNIEDVLTAQNALIEDYINGIKSNYVAQSYMCEALGLDDEAANAKSSAQGFSESNVKGIKAKRENSKSIDEKIEKEMATHKELSSEAKALVAKSLIPLSQSIISYKGAAEKSAKTLDNAKSVLSNASMTKKLSIKRKLDPVLSIAPKVPGDLTNLLTLAGNYVKFAKSKDIKIPKDLNAALGD